jgi:hypothetical protein
MNESLATAFLALNAFPKGENARLDPDLASVL